MRVLLLHVAEEEEAEREAEACREEQPPVEGHHHQHQEVGQQDRQEVGEGYDQLGLHREVEIVTTLRR